MFLKDFTRFLWLIYTPLVDVHWMYAVNDRVLRDRKTELGKRRIYNTNVLEQTTKQRQ